MEHEQGRPDPEQLLRQLEADEARSRRARLKVFLGCASGVGKSHRMLDEGRRRKGRGEDVVVAGLQPHASQEIEKILASLEIIPEVSRGEFSAIDVERIIHRRPEVCLVDGLAYPNPPDWPTSNRWQDVERLLDSGISVITSLNLQHIEEKADIVARIRGRRAVSTVPEAFLHRADEVVVVDAPPEYILRRSREIGTGGNSERNLEQQFSELRELALLLAADVVDGQLDRYLKAHGIQQTYGTQERILVCVTPRGDTSTMIARGRRQADRFHGELNVVHVEQANLSPGDQDSVDRSLALARDLGAKVELLHGPDPIQAILRFARAHGITQIFVGHSRRTDWWDRFWGNPVERLIIESEGIDVRVFPN